MSILKDHTKHILFTINASTKTPLKATLENNLQRGQRKDQKIKKRINGSGSLKGRDARFVLSVGFSYPELSGYSLNVMYLYRRPGLVVIHLRTQLNY